MQTSLENDCFELFTELIWLKDWSIIFLFLLCCISCFKCSISYTGIFDWWLGKPSKNKTTFLWQMWFFIFWRLPLETYFYLRLFTDRWRYSPKPSENNTEDNDYNYQRCKWGNESHFDEELGFNLPWSNEPNLTLKQRNIDILGWGDAGL